MRTLRRVVVGLLFVALFWAAWQFTHRNDAPIAVDLLAVRVPAVPTWAALMAAFGAGGLLAGLAFVYELTKQRLVARRYRKAVTGLESEIHQLRNLPLAEEGGRARPPAAADVLDRSA
jgi:hypothetical protein